MTFEEKKKIYQHLAAPFAGDPRELARLMAPLRPTPDAAAYVERARQLLGELQGLLSAEGERAGLVVLQGRDASGKDGTVRHVFDACNPMGLRVTSFKAPAGAERAHDYLWRWDTDWFWCSKNLGAQHPLVRRLMPLTQDDFSEADARHFVAGKERLWAEHGYGPWAFFVGGRFAGWGGLQPEAGDADLGLVLHPDFWGWGKRIYDETLRRAPGLGVTSITMLLPPSRARVRSSRGSATTAAST